MSTPEEANKKYWARKDKVLGKGYTKDLMSKAHKVSEGAKSKVLEGKKKEERERYEAAPMPKNVYGHAALSEYYKTHKGKMVSNKVNPETGKYFNTK